MNSKQITIIESTIAQALLKISQGLDFKVLYINAAEDSSQTDRIVASCDIMHMDAPRWLEEFGQVTGLGGGDYTFLNGSLIFSWAHNLEPKQYAVEYMRDGAFAKEIFQDTDSASKALGNIKRRKGVTECVLICEWDSWMPPAMRTKNFVAAPVEEATPVEDFVEAEPQPVQQGELTWVKFKEVAQYLGVRYQQVYQKMEQGSVRTLQINNRWHACWEDVVSKWQPARNKYFERGFAGKAKAGLADVFAPTAEEQEEQGLTDLLADVDLGPAAETVFELVAE